MSFTVTNTGPRPGKEVAQVYVTDDASSVFRPQQELKAFRKVTLEAGESTRVDMDLNSRAFAFWHPTLRRWVVEPGEFAILVGGSSRDIRLHATIDLAGEDLTLPVDADSTAEQWLAHPTLRQELLKVTSGTALEKMLSHPQSGQMMRAIPLRRLPRFPASTFTEEWLEETAAAAYPGTTS